MATRITAPPAPAGDARVPAGGETRTFRRSLLLRLLSLATASLLVVALAARVAAGELGVGLVVVAGLALLALAGLAGAWGDRVTIDDRGIEIGNVLLRRLGFRGRRVTWSEVVAVREHRRLRPGGGDAAVTALFVLVRRGRRLVLDSLQDFEVARRMVAERRSDRTSGVQ